MHLLAAIQLFTLLSFTSALPSPRADAVRNNSCPYSLYTTSAILSDHTYPKVTWAAAPANTVHYPLSFAAGTTAAPSPANCMIVQGAPYCLIVAANSMANILWTSMGASVAASAVCPTRPWTTAASAGNLIS